MGGKAGDVDTSAEQVDDLLAAGGVAAAGAAEGLAERAGDDIDTAFDAAMRAYSSPMLFLGEPEIAFAAAFVAPISRFAVLLPDASAEEGGDEPDMGGQLPLFPTDPNALRADLLHDALRQLARRGTSIADTLSAVLSLYRAAFDVDREQVARLTGVVALAVTPLHNRWPVTAQERALSVKYLRP